MSATPVHPDPARPEAGAVLISVWDVGTPERQRAAADAIAATWGKREWPTPDMLSYGVYAGTDGRTLLHYSQWTGEEAYEEYVRTHRQERNDEIDDAVPGIERLRLTRTRRYRSLPQERDGRGREGKRPEPGCVVVVEVGFEGPDEARQRAWVDTVAAAIEEDRADGSLPPGGISAHFHLSTDGTRVVNYAEWESEQAHIDALEAPGEGVGTPSPLWERVRNFPGLVSSDVARYRLLFSTERPGEPAERAAAAARQA
ncbi:antibiotic biosynthesis monooxygenase [Streptomyces radiopugnans]|uniref:Antibiotic biosynthesis monooxygenase n=1 Tax=Streptomyces radiopugnans TaxID=403935 RepID=A0A1H9K372_9ACTN|nr:antibiotic biosynthesis monooxygenase [Streptomyces radiopugnans]SEQ93383.1 Antibiotic biosynthesis monooxygenase [Streptomyces radiopugnans]